jgi:glucosamine-6-phosphate deaminase
MGGTFQRLVNQGHDVHVAYQTSGNIAVGDEEVIRYLSVFKHLIREYDPDNKAALDKLSSILHHLFHEKGSDDVDIPEVRFLKGRIRREEARSADRYVGLPHSHVHFLDLPFYETGKVKKDPISEMESAPFLGDDERLFWQRSEERNRATANMYDKLGLASYEAIEAFVEYKPLRDNIEG